MKQNMTFDDLLTITGVSKADRIIFTRSWLSTNYGIKVANEEWVDALSDVHDHDNLPKHFGQIKVGTAFAAVTTQLVRVPEGWHLAVAGKREAEGIILHPLHEAASSQPSNVKMRPLLVQIVKNGKVLPQRGSDSQQPASPTQLITEDTPDAVADFNSAPVTPNAKTTSVSIDMSQFM